VAITLAAFDVDALDGSRPFPLAPVADPT